MSVAPPITYRNPRVCLLICLASLGLIACGNKGPLFLPEREAVTVPLPAESDEAASDEEEDKEKRASSVTSTEPKP